MKRKREGGGNAAQTSRSYASIARRAVNYVKLPYVELTITSVFLFSLLHLKCIKEI